MNNKVILVDYFDNELGEEDKIIAHVNGNLHRAFSVFVVNNQDELLLQQRALHKYHSPGLWSNTCCSHPALGMSLITEAKNRLSEEMGFTCHLQKLFDFVYKTEFSNGLTEHEFDHVFLGFYESDPQPNEDEVNDWSWRNIHDLKEEITGMPELYTFWFRHVYERFFREYSEFTNSLRQ